MPRSPRAVSVDPATTDPGPTDPGPTDPGPTDPGPTDAETAAIVAAVEALWPQPDADEAEARRASAWKFSGRWWSQPIPLRRARPWT